jgi:hypothetical protein
VEAQISQRSECLTSVLSNHSDSVNWSLSDGSKLWACWIANLIYNLWINWA